MQSFWSAALFMAGLVPAGLLAGPGLEWEQTLVLRQGALEDEHVDAAFRFRNAGTEPVTIERIEATCGCLLTSLDQKQYAPGEAGELKALMDVSDQAGTEEKAILVWTNGSAQPEVLKLRVTMPHWLKLSPPAVWWLVGSEPQGRQVELTLDPGLKVTDVRSTNPGMEVTVASNPAGEPTHLVVSPESTAQPLRARIDVVVETSTGRRRTFVLLASVR
jgi:hypothetical protein